MSSALLANLASTLFLTGLAWSLACVQLPILLRGDYPELIHQLALHRRLNSQLMVIPMSVEFFTAVWLVVAPPAAVGRASPAVGLALICVIGYATVWYSLLHRKLARGFHKPTIDAMRTWNLVRTISWTARSALLLWIVFRIAA
ncbi:MAG TPA: hypothetical protein VKR43_07490 [Bryobacteraceae bacterium]|nr:hypothetical protein [Bryobacteraceae bacterium]